MASTPESSNTPEKPDESADIPDDLILDDLDESSLGEPLVIDAEVADDPIDEAITEENAESDEIAESFPPDSEPVPQKSSFLPMLLGGLVAGAIGFFAAFALVPGLATDKDAMASIAEATEKNAASLGGLGERLDELGASIPKPVDTSGLESAVTSLEGQSATLAAGLTALQEKPDVDLSGITGDLSSLAERVTALEVSEGNASSAQAAEAEAQLEAFKVDLAALIADAEAKIAVAEERAAEIEAAAAAAALVAEKEAVLSKLKASVDGGATYKDLIEGLESVPPELANHADNGVPTLVVLQQDFPDAARAALATVQTVPDDASTTERLTAFLRRQTNARSLAPKEGDTPDAILSRAEAQLGKGLLPETLTELDALPDEAKSAMSGWLTDAKTRQAALQAVDALSAKTN